MLAKSLLKYPVFILGLGMFLLFIFNEKTSIWWNSYTDRFKPNVCKDAALRVEKMGEKNWEVICNEQDLIIKQEFMVGAIKEGSLEKASYRQLANNLMQLSRIVNHDTIALIKIVNFRLVLADKEISSFITGPALIQLSKLTDEKAIAFFIHTSVKVKEVPKE